MFWNWFSMKMHREINIEVKSGRNSQKPVSAGPVLTGLNHRWNKCVLHYFYSGNFLTFFKHFFLVFYLKTLSNAKYEYAKIQPKILLEDASGMIFIDFGLLRIAHAAKYLTYSLKSTDIKIRVRIWQPKCDSVCKDNSWIYGKCRQRFMKRLQTFFFKYFFHVFTYFYFYLKVLLGPQFFLHLWFNRV